MPEIAFLVSGSYPSCDTFHWSISVEYTDPAGYETYYATSYESDYDEWDLFSWGGGDEEYSGGDAIVDLQIYDGSGTLVGSADFNFTILGENQSKTLTDANEGPLPWFGGRVIARESSGRQFSANRVCDDNNFCGDPLWGSPDGIGLMQPDRTENPQVFSNCTYWSFVCNISSGEQVLRSTQSGAYSYWTSQVTAQLKATGNVAVPTSDNCAGNSFTYPPEGGQSGTLYYGDAEWIKRYNGGYYVKWGNGAWVKSDANGYLLGVSPPGVCNSSPF